jgi:hypothetical protein
MAKSHYSFKKRKKEIARKLKQEQKRERKISKKTDETDIQPNEDQETITPSETI